MPVVGFWVLNKFNTTSFQGSSFYLLVGIIILLTILIPAYFVFALKRSGAIERYEMETLRERRLPLLFTSVVLLFTYYLIHRSHLPELYQGYFLSVTIASTVSFGISLFYKISLHTLGIGFLFGLGLLLSSISSDDMRWYFITLLLIGGVVSSSRIVLRAHTLLQVYIGFAMGIICAMVMFLFL